MTDPSEAGFDIRSLLQEETPQGFAENDDDEDAADGDDDDVPSSISSELLLSRSDFGTLEWWSRT